MTYVKFVYIVVKMTVWTSAIEPGHPILARKLFKNKKNKKTLTKIAFTDFSLPLYFSMKL